MATKKQEEKVEQEEKVPSLNRIIAEINKAAGEVVASRIGKMETDLSIEFIPSGIKGLDEAMGGGFPRGRMVELYGVQSAGKSLISAFVTAQAQKKGYDCIWIDCEDTFEPGFAARLGVDVNNLILMQDSMAEDIVERVGKMLKAKPALIVIDSVAAMITRTEMEKPVEDVIMAPKARLLSRALPKLTFLNQDTCIIFVNQMRTAVSTWGPSPAVTTGGRALGHYMTIRLEVKKGEEMFEGGKKSGEVIGHVVQYLVTKNKVGKPKRFGSFKYFYDDCRVEE
jgi:recombination protein RecA